MATAKATTWVSFQQTIENISKLDEVYSSTYVIQEIPWRMIFVKTESEANASLGVHLDCSEEKFAPEKSSGAKCTIKLLPSDTNNEALIKYIDPFIADPLYTRLIHDFISWDELVKVDNQYVKNDTINFEIRIDVSDKEERNKSQLTFERIETSCCWGTYQLTVSNINNLMVVKSPEIKLHSFPFNLIVLKNHSDDLLVSLENDEMPNGVSCKLRIEAELVSSKDDAPIVSKTTTEVLSCQRYHRMTIISFEELIKPEKGYVNNDSIVIKVDFKASDPQRTDGAKSLRSSMKRCTLECAICLAVLGDQNVSNTKCGHVFCTTCITNMVKTRKFCPTCKTILNENELSRIVLPFVD